MNKKHLFISATLVLGIGAVGLTGLRLQNKPIEADEVKATEEETTYYLCGRFDTGYSNYAVLPAWDNTNTTYAVSTNASKPSVFNFKKWNSDTEKGDEFKFVLEATWTGALGYNELNGTAKKCFGYGGNDNTNIYCNETGSYNVYISNGALYIDYADFYLQGTTNDGGQYDANWTDYTAKPLAINGDAQTFDLAVNDQFLLRRDSTYLKITECVDAVNKDGNYYSYFRCFKNDNDNNIVAQRADKYNVSLKRIGADLKISITANSVSTNTVYVLDLNGNLLAENHRAHYWNGAQATEEPGLEMDHLAETNNIYTATYWDIFTNANFNNGTTYTVNETLTGNEGKCLVLDWAYEEEHWTSDTWVDLEAGKFIDGYMKFDDKHQDNAGSGDCVSSGWYTAAKKAYEAVSFESHRSEVCKSSLVVARLQKWALANGEAFEINDGVGTFSGARVAFSSIENKGNSNLALVTFIAGSVVVIGLGSAIVLRKRKEND